MLSKKTIETIKSTVPVLEVKGTEITTVFYKNMFENHPELLNIFNHANQKKGRQQTALANTVLAAATYIDKLESIIPVVKQIGHKHRSLGIKPEHYPIVGEYLLGAIKQVLGDAATDDIINAWAEAYGVIAQVFIDIEKEMYKEVTSSANGWSDFKEFKVIEKVKECEAITSFYLVPADNSSVPNFIPGQYITIRLRINGEKYLVNRQYSLSAAPGKEYFRISVKREAEENIPEGKASNYLHDFINQGDLVEVTAPAGDFTISKKETPIVFLSGGVGITPFMSMVNSLAENQPSRQIQFINASRNGKLQAFKEELEALNVKLSNYKLLYVYENPSEADKQEMYFGKEGYIDTEWIKENVVTAGGEYFVCGPVSFMRAIVLALKKLNVADSQIHYEFFGPAINLEETELQLV